MTPPRLDVDASLEKLALLSDLIADLERQGEPTGADLRADRDRRHVVERILTQLVDIAVGLNAVLVRAGGHRRATGYRDSFDLLVDAGVASRELVDRLAPSAGMRNILTREYGTVDLDQVAAAVPVARRDYGAYVEVVRAFLAAQPER